MIDTANVDNMDSSQSCGERFCDNIESLRHGKTALLITAITVVATAALLISASLLIAGINGALFSLIGCGIIVISATVLLGPKVFYDYAPALCRMVVGFCRGQPEIQANGSWEGEKVAHAHFFDHQLCKELCQFFSDEKAERVADFGCGTGEYVRTIRSELEIACDGFDGNPDTPAISKGACQVQNLAIPFQAEKPYDWVMSLEVGEHLPKEFERVFIDNLMNNATKGIVLSWAKKGQGGHGHVNEQDNDYIKAIFQEKGWVNDVKAENRLRNASYPVYFWYYDTVMVFRRP